MSPSHLPRPARECRQLLLNSLVALFTGLAVLMLSRSVVAEGRRLFSADGLPLYQEEKKDSDNSSPQTGDSPAMLLPSLQFPWGMEVYPFTNRAVAYLHYIQRQVGRRKERLLREVIGETNHLTRAQWRR